MSSTISMLPAIASAIVVPSVTAAMYADGSRRRRYGAKWGENGLITAEYAYPRPRRLHNVSNMLWRRMDGHAELVGVGLTDGDLGKRDSGKRGEGPSATMPMVIRGAGSGGKRRSIKMGCSGWQKGQPNKSTGPIRVGWGIRQRSSLAKPAAVSAAMQTLMMSPITKPMDAMATTLMEMPVIADCTTKPSA